MKAKLILVFVVAVALTACKDRDAEKKVAALEARLAELEGKKNATAPTAASPKPEIKPEGPLPVMQFEKTDHDFGTVKEGEKVSYVYKFTNTGEVPLIIQDAKASCGCTVPDWTKVPVPPGGEGFVKAEFDTKGKPNAQNKTVTVTANTWPKQTKLTFKAMVLKSASGPSALPVK